MERAPTCLLHSIEYARCGFFNMVLTGRLGTPWLGGHMRQGDTGVVHSECCSPRFNLGCELLAFAFNQIEDL